MRWLEDLLVRWGLIVDIAAPLPRSSDAWYGGMLSSDRLTKEEEYLLDLFTEDEWRDLIPMHVKVSSCKLTVKHSVMMFENYVLTGEWS